jgi:hypothetical protein
MKAMKGSNSPARVLFLLYKSESPSISERFQYFSCHFGGDIIAPKPQECSGESRLGEFGFHTFATLRRIPLLRRFLEILAYVRIASMLIRSGQPYDLVVAVGLFKTALAGLLIKLFYGSKLLVEVPIVLEKIHKFRWPKLSFVQSMRALLFPMIATLLLRRADHLKLIFPTQLGAFSILRRVPCSSFPDYVPIRIIDSGLGEEFVLLVGTPLYLKGADLLIQVWARKFGVQ